jgi:hypothetical protein
MSDSQDTHQAALDYAQQGLRVVPIMPGEKRPSLNQWQDLATTDVEQINLWFMGKYSGHGVGIATGEASGIWVLDVDNSDSLHDLEAEYGNLPETLCAVTGSGGEHHVFSYPSDGRTIRNSASGLRPGLDVRGEGGQIVAAPTIHPNGQPYSWADFAIEVTAAPEWLLDLVCEMVPAPEPLLKLVSASDRPGDLFAAATDWAEILERDGWQLHHVDGSGERHWTRPGKELRDGASATTGFTSNDHLKMFTSSHPQLRTEETYSKIGYLAAVHHSGDFSAAAQALAADGYRADPATYCEPQQVATNAVEGDPPSLLEQMRVDWGDFWDRDHSEENWLLEPLLAKGRNHSITAAAKAGKSLITLAALAPASLGQAVLGRPAGTPLRTLYLDYEMSAADVQERLSGMGFDQRFRPEPFAYLLHTSLPPLDTQAGGIQVHELATQHDADLVVIDTYSRAIEGADDSTDTIKGLYRHTITPLLARGIAVLRLDHTGHKSKERARGSSGKGDDIDLGWMLTKTDEGIKLKSTHARMQWVPETVNLKLRTDPLGLELVQGGWPHGTKDAADKLSAAGVISGDSQRTAREKLKAAEIPLSQKLLGPALNYLTIRIGAL